LNDPGGDEHTISLRVEGFDFLSETVTVQPVRGLVASRGDVDTGAELPRRGIEDLIEGEREKGKTNRETD
jgi:hypothetical protein